MTDCEYPKHTHISDCKVVFWFDKLFNITTLANSAVYTIYGNAGKEISKMESTLKLKILNICGLKNKKGKIYC